MRLVILVVLFAATTCYAVDEWTWIGSSTDPNINGVIELEKASLEIINDSTVRARTRFVKKDKDKPWNFGENVQFSEMIADYDCTKPRFKMLQATDVYSSGGRSEPKVVSTPVFQKITEGSLWDVARQEGCKALPKR